MTEAPSAASDLPMADPIPLDAPVTIATLPVSLLRLLPIFRCQTQIISAAVTLGRPPFASSQ